MAEQNIQVFGGLNSYLPADKIPQDDLQSCENLDFAHEPGVATVRRGSVVATEGTQLAGALAEVHDVFFHFNNIAIANSPTYAVAGTNVYRIIDIAGTDTVSLLATNFSNNVNDVAPFSSYRENVLIGVGTGGIRDDGTNTTSWIPPAPSGKLTVSLSTATPITVVSTYTIQEGTTSGATFAGTGTATTDGTTFRTEFRQTATATNLDLNGTATIGDNGIHSIDLSFSRPERVSRISIDYSIGDANFTNYLHGELLIDEGEPATADSEVLVDSVLESDPDENINADLDDVAEAKSTLRRTFRSRAQVQRISASKDSFNTWSLAVPLLEFIGRSNVSGLTNIQSVRVIVECSGACVVKVRNWVIQGDEEHPLNDPNVGYSWWETFATVETFDGVDVVTNESAPTPASDRVKVINGQAVVSSGNSPTGGHGLTHRITYRQGGLLRDAYAVATTVLATATITDTVNDISALIKNRRMTAGIRTSLPSDMRAISREHHARIFIGYGNKIAWSLPGKPGTFPTTSFAEVSHSGDPISKLIVAGDRLIIVNRDSVYEMVGNVFEGRNRNWVLRRSQARTGSVAPRATIETPFGVVMWGKDGISLYQPGQRTDFPLDWAMNQIGDIFRGTFGFDPAFEKGTRVEPQNPGFAHLSCATFRDNQLYVAYPTNTNTRPDKVLVCDFNLQKSWVYSYPFKVRSMFTERGENSIIAGVTEGAVMRLLLGFDDKGANGTTTQIQWNAKTRRWTTPADTLSENLFLEYQNGGVTIAHAIYDTTNTATLGTLSSAGHDWFHPALSGTFANSAEFLITGTQTSTTNHGALFNLQWESLIEPKRVNFWRTEHDLVNHDGDKVWDVHFADVEVIGTGSVFGTVFIDNTAVMTQTIAGPTSGRIIQEKSFPVETVGEVAYTRYSSSIEFKHWKTNYAARPEPPNVTEFKTTPECFEKEHLFEAVDVCVGPFRPGTSTEVTHEVFIDNVSVGTFTSTISRKFSKTYALPVNTYGRTAYVIHRGLFKHYNTWFHKRPEPERWLNFQWDPKTFPSETHFKTWVVDINPLGGTATGTVYIDGVAALTQTFTGATRNVRNIALDLDGSNNPRVGTRVEIDYTATTVFKHYDTQVETEPKPFGKKQWQITYRKIGGATRLDMARSFNLDLEPASGTATVTQIWDADDGIETQTNTLTFTGREWRDQTPFAPGFRGYIFRQRLFSNVDFHVWSAGLDIERVGRKGVSIVSVRGTPS